MNFTAAISWRPGIGDPTLLGWITVVIYAIAAFLCIRASFASVRAPGRVGFPAVWTLYALLLILLGFNKQLDLQTLVIEAGRQLALSEGWYEKRRAVQMAFTVILAVGMLILLGVLVRRNRGFMTRHPWAALGTLLLLCYVLVRASVFDHLGSSRGIDLDRLRWTSALELGGIACIAVAATRENAKSRNAPAILDDESS
jgi:undecaprenyl pyrophosphate phosphatase UppP